MVNTHLTFKNAIYWFNLHSFRIIIIITIASTHHSFTGV